MYAVLNLHYEPSRFANLPPKEKAFVIACIKKKIEAEEKQRKEIQRQSARAKKR